MSLDQVFIALTGMTSILLTQQKNEGLKKYACILGLIGQPFWFYSSYQAEQWGIFILCFGYTYAWFVGFKNYWLNLNKHRK